MRALITYLLMLAALLSMPMATAAADLNDRLLNRPYADNRAWHLGFGFGMNFTALQLTHSGYTSAGGERWFMEQPAYSPGFAVNGLVSLRLNDYLSVRVAPGMFFASRELKMLDSEQGHEATQNIRSTFVVLPVDLKYAGMRFRNIRPYVSAGLMPTFDVSKKRTDMLRLKTTDLYLTIAAGGDFYLPYFKLVPEIKFCLGLRDVLEHDRPDLADNPEGMKFTQAIDKALSRMVILTFYFE